MSIKRIIGRFFNPASASPSSASVAKDRLRMMIEHQRRERELSEEKLMLSNGILSFVQVSEPQ